MRKQVLFGGRPYGPQVKRYIYADTDDQVRELDEIFEEKRKELDRLGFNLVKLTEEQIEERRHKQIEADLRKRICSLFKKTMPYDMEEHGLFVSETMSAFCENIAELIQYIVLAEEKQERYTMKCPKVWLDVLKASRLEYSQ